MLCASLDSLKRGVLLGLLAVMALSARPSFAQITGFGDGSNFTLNGYDQDNLGNIINTNDLPTISGGTLTITNLTQAQGRSAFFNTPQNISSFIASFTFQNQVADQSPLGAADGFAFVVQSQGLHAVGGTSAGLGYTVNDAPQPPSGPAILAIAPSAAEEFYLRNGIGATQFGVNGSGTFAGATPSDPVDLADGDPIRVTLIYDGTAFTLSETLTNLANPLLTYTLTRSADIQDVVGTTGFVGFTGATGGAYLQPIDQRLYLLRRPGTDLHRPDGDGHIGSCRAAPPYLFARCERTQIVPLTRVGYCVLPRVVIE